MGRCIIVLCTGRDGSSAVSGILHKLGVYMGDKFEQPGPRVAPFGSFEDSEIHRITERVLKGESSPEEYRPFVEARCAKHDLWGAKHPSLVHTAHYLIPMIQEAGHEVRVVVTTRYPPDIINSFMRAWTNGRMYAEQWYSQVSALRAARLLEFPGLKLQVAWADVKNNPLGQTARLAEFALSDYREANPKLIEKAAEHIVPGWKPPPVEGWGDMCFGCRVAKHPEVEFFCDWTTLMLTGRRENDHVLIPTKYMPGHWAGTELARKFLKETDCNTLMLLDDDMSFTVNQVNDLRDNPANFEYDVVTGLAMRRAVDDPSPVIMKWLGNAKMPDALMGKHYTLRPDFIPGEVVEVDTVGLAFTMIRRHVLEAMVDDAYGVEHTFFFTWGKGHEGDDVPFSQKCNEMGFRMAVDTSVQVGHLCAVPLTWEMLADRVKTSKEAHNEDMAEAKGKAGKVMKMLTGPSHVVT